MNGRPPEIPPHKLISALRGYDLLPAIVFLPTRRKCDEAATEVAADKRQPVNNEKLTQRKELFDRMAETSPEIRRHKHANVLVNAGVAAHHAGHIPSWKLTVEKMMSAGLLNAIFATSTVAAGVDFPARTVVITNADTRGNDGWRSLSASELQQMTGRAGRRGKDKVGFAILIPGQFQNPKKIAELLGSKPEPLESKFRATYTTLLNLLDAFGNFEQIREVAEKSFAFRESLIKLNELRSRRDKGLGRIADAAAASNGAFTIEDVRGFERLTSSRHKLDHRMPVTRADMRRRWLTENVMPGRIVTQGRSAKRLFMVINVRGETISAMRDDGQGRTFPIDRINRIYDGIFALKESSIETAFLATFEGSNKPIAEPKLNVQQLNSEASVILDKLIAEFAPHHDKLWELSIDAGQVDEIEREIDLLRANIWQPFEDRAKVLDHFGYLDFQQQQVLPAGKWLADLRVDRPLLVGEALKNGIFDDLDIKLVAALMASLAADPDRSFGELYLSNQLLDVVADFEELIREVSIIEARNGIEPAEEINLSAAAAAERWAGGMSWSDLVARTKAEEGDLIRLLSRTGEALMQLAHLNESAPDAAAAARAAAEMVLREPIR